MDPVVFRVDQPQAKVILLGLEWRQVGRVQPEAAYVGLGRAIVVVMLDCDGFRVLEIVTTNRFIIVILVVIPRIRRQDKLGAADVNAKGSQLIRLAND